MINREETTVMINREAAPRIGMVVHQSEFNEWEEDSATGTIETDASMLGWGASCRGMRTGGLWSQTENKNSPFSHKG